MKYCNGCETTKSFSEFYHHKRDGLTSRCKMCCREYDRNHRPKPKKTQRQIQKENGIHREFMAKRLELIKSIAFSKWPEKYRESVEHCESNIIVHFETLTDVSSGLL